jgi:hypothetical protein
MCAMRMSLGLVVVAAIAAPACATPRSRADHAFATRRYAEAADRYEALADEAPADTWLAARLRETRQRALLDEAAAVRAARDAGHAPEALRRLAALLEGRDGWGLAGDAVIAGPVAIEVTWARAHVRREIDAFVRAGRPAAARAIVASRRAQLGFADLAPLWTELDVVLAAASGELCRGLDARTPYLAAVASAHCARVGAALALDGALPHAVGGVIVAGDIEGMPAAQRAALVAALERGLAATPWYGRGAERAAVDVAGAQTIERTSDRVMREVPWSERVPEKKVLPTPYRLAGQTMYVAKTVYREEERWFTYQALRHDAEYRGDWRLAIAIGPRTQALIVQVADRVHRTGFDHDVTSEDAGVTPTRADLPTDADWSQHLVAKLEPLWRDQLAAHWRASFCEEVEYTAETAARCALGATPPPAARQALAAVLGPDVDLVLAARTK